MYRNKYNARKKQYAGYTFDSGGERDLFHYLKLCEKAGELKNIRTQPNVHLTRARILYKPDFEVETNTGLEYYEFKGFETVPWRIKRRLWIHYGPSVLYVYKKNKQGLFVHETITPKVNKNANNDTGISNHCCSCDVTVCGCPFMGRMEE